MKVNVALKPRWGHTITSFPVGHGLTEATMFGGTALPWVGSEEKQPKLADTSLLQFGEFSIAQTHTYSTGLLTCDLFRTYREFWSVSMGTAIYN